MRKMHLVILNKEIDKVIFSTGDWSSRYDDIKPLTLISNDIQSLIDRGKNSNNFRYYQLGFFCFDELIFVCLNIYEERKIGKQSIIRKKINLELLHSLAKQFFDSLHPIELELLKKGDFSKLEKKSYSDLEFAADHLKYNIILKRLLIL